MNKFLYIKFVLLLTMILNSDWVQSQNTTQAYNNIWFRLFINDKITDRLHWDFMFQHRRQAIGGDLNVLEKQQLQSYWLWFHYTLSKFKLSVSPFCYFETHYLYDLDTRPTREWRWCARIEHQQKFNCFQMLNRLGIEYRWRDLDAPNQFSGNFRTRYMLRFIYPLLKMNEKTFNFILSDEVFIQFGKAVKNYPSYFDQNRTYAGFNYEVIKNVKLELGYCYILQYRPTGKNIDIQNAIWCFLTFENVFSQFKKKIKDPK